MALMTLGKYKSAIDVFALALSIDRDNKDLQTKMTEATLAAQQAIHY